MPTVRKQRQIGTEPLPAARLTAAETEVSQGAAVSRARRAKFGEIADLGQGLAAQGVRIFGRQQDEKRAAAEKAAEEEKRKADQVAVLASDNRLADFLVKNLYDAQTGALAQQGPASFELPEKLEAEFDKLASDIEKGLANDDQRIAFERIRGNRREAMQHAVHSHVSRERQTYAASELKANTENAITLVIANAHTPRIGRSIVAGAEGYIKSIGPQLGMGPEAIESAVDDFRARAVAGAVQALIDSGHTDAARVYYEDLGAFMRGDDQAKMEKALKAGELKKKSQTAADTITTGGGTPDEWREKAKRIDDPDVREDTLKLVEHEITFVERKKREDDEGRMRRGADVVRRTGSVRNIPTSDWSAMTFPQQHTLEEYAESRARGVAVKTQFRVYNGLMELAGDDPDAFADVNLNDYVNTISETDLEKLAGMKKSIKDGDRRKADQVLDGFLTNQQIVNDILAKGGLDPTPEPGSDQVVPVMQFREEVDRAVQQLQVETGKKASNDDVRTIANSFFRKVIVEGSRSWFYGSDQEKALIDLPAADRIQRMTLADMPPSLRTLAEDSLRRAGQAVTPDAVLALFRRYLISQLGSSLPTTAPAPRAAPAQPTRGVTSGRGGAGQVSP